MRNHIELNSYTLSYKITGDPYHPDDMVWCVDLNARTEYEAIAQLVQLEKDYIITDIVKIVNNK